MNCGYHYEVHFVPDDAHWEKTGQRFTDFKTEFSAVARTLPIAKEPSLYISVLLDSTATHHYSEFISVTVPPARVKSLLAELRAWIGANNFDPRLLSVDATERPGVFEPVVDPFAPDVDQVSAAQGPFEQVTENGGVKFELEVRTLPDGEGSSFTFSLFRVRSSDKPEAKATSLPLGVSDK